MNKKPQELEILNLSDAAGNPAGGCVSGIGIRIDWQDGALGQGEDRLEPNGAFVETVIRAAMQRLEFYQKSKFACSENAAAIRSLNHAIELLNTRTARREEAGTEGTHEGN